MSYFGFTSKLAAVLETDSDVRRFQWNGVRVWPLLRILLFFKMFDREAETALQWSAGWLSPNHPWIILAEAVNRRFNSILAELGQEAPRDATDFHPRPAPPSGREGPVIVYASGPAYHSRMVADRAVEPVLDPWLELIAQDRFVLKLETATDKPHDSPRRHYPSLLIPAWTMKTVRQSGLADPVDDFINTFEAACWHVITFTREKFGYDLLELLKQDIRSYPYVAITRKYMFDDLFKAVRPSGIFMQNYYDPEHMGLLWSAAEQGIPTADVQHGTNGAYHPAYGHWFGMPDEGYHFLPDVFIVWGAPSARHIDRWLPRSRFRHRVVIGGQPGSAEAASTGDDPSAAALERFAHQYRLCVLVTLPLVNLWDERFWDMLDEAIARTVGAWGWLIRCHPMVAEADPLAARSVAQRLQNHANVDCLTASAAELRTVTRIADHHVTQVSSVVLDALAADVPTTFVHPMCFQIYASLIDGKNARVATNTDELLSSVAEGWTGLRRPAEPWIETDTDLARRAIADVLGHPPMPAKH